MSKPNEERDIYYIPPNFLASGRLFGGMIRARNAIEACVLVLLTGIPIIKLPMSLTVRIIILCLLPLPLGIFGIIGFEGDSLSEFAINWVRWFIHRRNLYRSDVTIPETARKQKKRIEACGVDTEIYARNVSWEWFSDIADLHSTGDLVVARVLDVTYNEQRDTYAVNLSIKDASENPDRAALEKIVPNSNYFGVVTGVKDRVFFVRLQAGVNAKTKLYRSIDMPSRLDTVSFRVTRVDEENGIALGFITRIIKRHTRLR